MQCWGENSYGELGNGTTSGPDVCGGHVIPAYRCSTTPVAVQGLTGATAVSVGSYWACALLSGGTVQCWGDGVTGDDCGDAGSACSSTPVAVPWFTGATAISVGDPVCALLSGGSVECWGDSATPVAVPGLAGATAISAGGLSACSLLSGGTVQCWGDNTVGELGIGTSTGPDTCASGGQCSPTPVTVQ